MSGPKVSEAELKRNRLDELIRNENLKISMLNSKIRMLEGVLREFAQKKKNIVEKYNELLLNCGETRKKEFEALYSYFNAECENLVRSIDYRNIGGVQEAIHRITNSECISSFWKSVCELRKTLDEFHTDNTDNFKINNVDVSIDIKNSALEEGLADYIDKLENSYSSDEIKLAEKLLVHMEVLISGNEFIGDDFNMMEKYHRELESVVLDKNRGKVRGVSVENISAYIKSVSKYTECYHEYVSYAIELGITPSPISKFYTADEIAAELNAIKKQMTYTLSQRYIEHSINEVMIRHGYKLDSNLQVVGAVTNSQSACIDNVYQNNDKHIRIFSSASGHTVMEVVGKCSSEEDQRKRYNEQVAFCELYPEIIEELERDYDIRITTKKDMKSKLSCRELIEKNSLDNNRQKCKSKDCEREMAMR